MGELGRGWCRGRAHRAAPAEPGQGRRRRPCGPRPAACRGWGEAGRSPDGRDARRSGRKSADAARRAAGLRPRFLRPAGAQRPPAERGAGGSFAVLADELPDEGALRDELGTDGEEVAVAFQQAFHRFTVFPGVLYLLQQAGDDSAV